MVDYKKLAINYVKQINLELKEKKSQVLFDDLNKRVVWDFTEHMLIAKKSVLFSLFELKEDDIK